MTVGAHHEYKPTDADSQQAHSEYTALVKSIKTNMNPDSNTVLIVDDEKGIRRFVKRSIKKSAKNIVFYEAENGQKALEILELIGRRYKRPPLFIVTDLNMPVMDGWEFIEHLRKEYEAQGKKQGIPVIVLSSTSGEKGMVFFGKSVHKAKYEPLVAVAKEACTDPEKYGAIGEKGLLSWVQQFGKYAK